MIPEIKKILYATDLSNNARYAFEYAASMAGCFGAGITVLHVLEEFSPNAVAIVEDFLGEERLKDLRKRNEDQVIESIRGRIENFCDDMEHKLPECSFIIDHVIVEIGHPVDRIIRQAEKNNCNMIIMGSHGQGVLKGAMMGSTSQRVLRRSEIPVLVIRLPKED
jgi:nucleotide-binding universal stress UspA family protein